MVSGVALSTAVRFVCTGSGIPGLWGSRVSGFRASGFRV